MSLIANLAPLRNLAGHQRNAGVSGSGAIDNDTSHYTNVEVARSRRDVNAVHLNKIIEYAYSEHKIAGVHRHVTRGIFLEAEHLGVNGCPFEHGQKSADQNIAEHDDESYGNNSTGVAARLVIGLVS